MEEIIVDTDVLTDEDGRPVLRLLVRGREVEARFADDRNDSVGPRLKQSLMDSYLRNIESKKTA